MAILSNSGRLAYGVKNYMVRKVEDILTIPLTPMTRPGSTVFVSSTQQRFVLDQDRNWVELATGNFFPGGDDSGEVIYEGGDISEGVAEAQADYEGGQIQ